MKVVFFTGAGISAESGIKTFRDADGLWEGHDVMEVASPQGWNKNQNLVLDFYNQRRRQLKTVSPNAAHMAIAKLGSEIEATVVTQNVDDLHERAGSNKVLHLHGELRKVRSVLDPEYIIPWEDDLHAGDVCPAGGQLRPHIVWFGEAVPAIEEGISMVAKADMVVIVGTSLQVYPAAGLIDYASSDCKIFYVDPRPALPRHLVQDQRIRVIEAPATTGVPIVVDHIKRER